MDRRFFVNSFLTAGMTAAAPSLFSGERLEDNPINAAEAASASAASAGRSRWPWVDDCCDWFGSFS
jgi:hypothetical protein